MVTKQFYIGVDVGTSSVRAGLFSSSGELVSTATHPVHIFEPEPSGFYEQSSDDIWQACCKCVKLVVKEVDVNEVGGIGFDATCSLVALDTAFQPVSVSPSGLKQWNVVMWMDHRAEAEATIINAIRHEVLRYVGGSISLEMQTPKLLWIKKNLPDSWSSAGHFFDLPDFLTWRSTGALSRSLCSLVCKWTYLASDSADSRHQGWQDSFFQQVGLADLVDSGYTKIGSQVLSPGTPVGQGLSASVATELGLPAGTPVATSVIDAHAGGIGCLGCRVEGTTELPLQNRLPLICGTSTCHMAVHESALFVPGIWGPYYSAMVPGMWTNEAGQSAAGKLIDHVVEKHPAYPWIKDESQSQGKHIQDVLNDILTELAKKEDVPCLDFLTRDLHVWPDYHGNRSPVADSSLKGMVSGLSLSSGVEDLARQYLATVQALAYSTRHILEALGAAGHSIKALHVCGGLSNNQLYVQSHADVTGLPVVRPNTSESVLLGSAILAACASGQFTSIQDAMKHMGGTGELNKPHTEINTALKQYHAKKYKVFLKMLEHQREYRSIMQEENT